MNPKMWERINIKWRKSYIEGGSKLVGKKGQFSMGIFRYKKLPIFYANLHTYYNKLELEATEFLQTFITADDYTEPA
jgi:hypothetical protein